MLRKAFGSRRQRGGCSLKKLNKDNAVPMRNYIDCVAHTAVPRRENQIKGRWFA